MSSKAIVFEEIYKTPAIMSSVPASLWREVRSSLVTAPTPCLQDNTQRV